MIWLILRTYHGWNVIYFVNDVNKYKVRGNIHIIIFLFCSLFWNRLFLCSANTITWKFNLSFIDLPRPVCSENILIMLQYIPMKLHNRITALNKVVPNQGVCSICKWFSEVHRISVPKTWWQWCWFERHVLCTIPTNVITPTNL